MKYKKEKLLLEIKQEDFSMVNSRDNDGNLGIMVLSHKNYQLPNEINLNFDDFDGWEKIADYLRKEKKATIILPVQGYDHSRFVIYCAETHDYWDGGQLGYIYTTAEKIKESFGKKRPNRQKLIELLQEEVKFYNQDFNGDVYEYILSEKKPNKICKCCGHNSGGEYKEIDAVGGYYNIADIWKDLKFNPKNWKELEN